MLTVREARPHDVGEIRDVIRAHVDDYPLDVGDMVADHDSAVVIGLDNTEIVGVTALHTRQSVSTVVDGLHGDDLPSPDDIEVDGEQFGLLTTGYVRPGRLREGIGRLLLSACLQHARQTGLAAVYVEARIYDESIDGRSLLDGQGFEQVYEATDYWDVDDCPVCEDECDCGGAIYRIVF